MKRCPRCRKWNDEEATECNRCGKSLKE